jgi:hypothetical protein
MNRSTKARKFDEDMDRFYSSCCRQGIVQELRRIGKEGFRFLMRWQCPACGRVFVRRRQR